METLGSVVKGLSLDDFAAAQAGRADANALALARDLGVHRTQVDVPAPLGDVVRVADAVSRLRLLAADFTLLCHWNAAPEGFRSCRANLDFTGQTAISAISIPVNVSRVSNGVDTQNPPCPQELALLKASLVQ